MQNSLYQALLEPHSPPPVGLTVWNGSDPAVRFAVYRNNIMASLTEALAENCRSCNDRLVTNFFGPWLLNLSVSIHPRRRYWRGMDMLCLPG